MDWINDPATREIALKVIVAFITALLAALGVDRQAWKSRAVATAQRLTAVQARTARLYDENEVLKRRHQP